MIKSAEKKQPPQPVSRAESAAGLFINAFLFHPDFSLAPSAPDRSQEIMKSAALLPALWAKAAARKGAPLSVSLYAKNCIYASCRTRSSFHGVFAPYNKENPLTIRPAADTIKAIKNAQHEKPPGQRRAKEQ